MIYEQSIRYDALLASELLRLKLAKYNGKINQF